MSTPQPPRASHPIPAARLASVVEQTPEVVLLTDLDGRIVYVNDGFTKTTGYTRAEALGQSPALLRSGLRDRDFYAHMWQTLLDGRSWNMVIPNRRKDGSVYWQQTNIFPVTDEDGQAVYFAGVGRDVSDRVKMTEELAAARDAAEAAARVKSDFLVNMSHEIRTPLNAVLGMADLLSDTALDARQRSQLDVLRGAGESLLGLVNEIMDVSKLEAGGMTLRSQLFELRELLEGAASVVAPMAHRRGLELLLRIDPRVDRSWSGDPVRIRQVLMNLLSNALKFTESGEVEIQAAPAGASTHGMGFVVSVRDTGSGIPADRLQSVFERFTQVDGSRTRRHGGAGLGLSLSRELCHLMGGTLSASSELGSGSTFTAILPLQRGAPGPREAAPLAGVQVLVADDHERHRSILAGLLSDAGADVTEVGELSAVEAELERSCRRECPIRAIVIDDTWAEGSVEATAQSLFRNPLGPGVVLITRVQDAHDPGDAIQERLVQPASRADLIAAVRRTTSEAEQRTSRVADKGTTLMGLSSDRAVQGKSPEWPQRILVVDDNAVNRLLVHALLEKEGSVVEEAQSGAEALARLARGPQIDAVLMDLVMPDMDGIETVRRLRQREVESGRTALPVIAFTAATGPDEVRRALDAGCDGYVGKPVRKDELLAEVAAAARARTIAAV
jgi:PAS domain S-box-containing protein